MTGEKKGSVFTIKAASESDLIDNLNNALASTSDPQERIALRACKAMSPVWRRWMMEEQHFWPHPAMSSAACMSSIAPLMAAMFLDIITSSTCCRKHASQYGDKVLREAIQSLTTANHYLKMDASKEVPEKTNGH